MDEKDMKKDLQKKSGDEPKANLEENDNWEFEAEAPTLNSNVIGNETFEIEIPDARAYETAQRPTKVQPVQTISTVARATVKTKESDKILFIFIALFVAIAILATTLLGVLVFNKPNSDERMVRGNTAMVVGETPVSIGMYNYYYTCISQNYIQYASYGYYDIDTTKSYSEQYTTDDDGNKITWEEKFEQDTVNQIQYITAYYEDALKHNVGLTQEQEEQIETSIDSLKETALSSMSKSESAVTDDDYNDYIAQTYGDYCGLKTLEKMLEQCYIAENYYNQKYLEFDVTEDEAQNYFENNQSKYLNVGFAYLQVAYKTDDDGNEISPIEECEGYASEVTSVDDMKKLIPTACKDTIDSYVEAGYATDADSCAEMLSENIEISITSEEEGFLEDAKEWLFSSDTPVGACKAFDDETNKVVYILYKTTEPKADETEVYSVRHILITPESDDSDSTDTTEDTTESTTESTTEDTTESTTEDTTESTTEDSTSSTTTYSDEAWADAETKANSILDEYNSGNKTEYAFAQLAEEYSDDTESTSSGSSGLYGGLYEGTKIGTMVSSFEEWATDPQRSYGDVGIVKSDYGYHIMYFIEDTKQYLYDCETALKKEKEDEFVDSVKIRKNSSAMEKVKVAKPTTSSSSSSSSSGY